MSATMTNNRVRKSLADQIDRLDAVIDGFADNLDAAVATAVKEGVTEAVRAVLHEVLTRPELSERLRPATQQTVTAAPPLGETASLKPTPAPVLPASTGVLGEATAAVRSTLGSAGAAVLAAIDTPVRLARQVPPAAFLGAAVGAVVVVGTVAAGPALTAAASAVAAAAWRGAVRGR